MYKNILKIKTLSYDYIDELDSKVNKLLKKGWTILRIYELDDEFYCQMAKIKERKEI